MMTKTQDYSSCWKSMSQVKKRDKEVTFLKTGIKKIDNLIEGLMLGSLSVWTGLNGSNKSGTLSQVILNLIDSKQCKCAIFSAELTSTRFKEWLYLQASGKRHNIQKTNDKGERTNFYITPERIVDRITAWIDDKLYLYDNDCGFDYAYLGNAIYTLIKNDPAVKFIVIDNLFTIDLSDLDRDKYEAQKKFLLTLTRIAQQMGVHIATVCHPRKSVSLLRKEDISGTADITNCADYVFICHRNDVDFRARSKEFFRWKDDNPVYEYDNIIEIDKDREHGVKDVFVGMYYETESKRILNYRGEDKIYGWDNAWQSNVFAPIDGSEDLPF